MRSSEPILSDVGRTITISGWVTDFHTNCDKSPKRSMRRLQFSVEMTDKLLLFCMLPDGKIDSRASTVTALTSNEMARMSRSTASATSLNAYSYKDSPGCVFATGPEGRRQVRHNLSRYGMLSTLLLLQDAVFISFLGCMQGAFSCFICVALCKIFSPGASWCQFF